MGGPYHHGDLRQAAMQEASRVLADEPEALTLRGVARALGVTHAALRYHFGSLDQLRSAVAAEGFARLGRALSEGAQSGRTAFGLAYVRWALTNPGHFRVMFGRDVVGADDPGLTGASEATFDVLRTTLGGDLPEMLVAWGAVHGLATLWLTGPLRERLAADEERFLELVEAALGRLVAD